MHRNSDEGENLTHSQKGVRLAHQMHKRATQNERQHLNNLEKSARGALMVFY